MIVSFFYFGGCCLLSNVSFLESSLIAILGISDALLRIHCHPSWNSLLFLEFTAVDSCNKVFAWLFRCNETPTNLNISVLDYLVVPCIIDVCAKGRRSIVSTLSF